jgi:L-aminopeptidase/D-esterase-like protein
MEAMMDGYHVVTSPGSNTMVGAVATNVPFGKAEMSKIAQMAHAVVQTESLTGINPGA